MLAIQITKDVRKPLFSAGEDLRYGRAVHVYPHLDVAGELRQARRLGGERMLLYSLRLANNLLGAVLPQEIISEMRFHPAIDGLVRVRSAAAF